jgi:DNA-binding SARP family transcriptional activator
MATLCAKALNAGIQVPFVLRMIQKQRFPVPPEARCLETWPWPIKVSTLGKFEILIEGRPLGKSRKAPHRLIELLTAIITYSGAPVSAARLMDMLWPEADGDQARENLKKSIARLRQLLAVDDVLRWQDGEISLNPARCWVDAWAFEVYSEKAELRGVTGLSTLDGHEDIKVVPLYRGPFLGWSEIPSWAGSYRERLRKQFTRLFTHREKVVDGMQRKELMAELARAIDVDPVAEPLYQQLIPLLVSANRHAEAAAYYDRCRTELARWAGRSASADLQELAQTISFL